MTMSVPYTVGYMRQPTSEQQRHRENAGDLLRRAREAKGLTQGALADRLGVSRSTVVSYEQGDTGLLVDRLPAIEQAVGLTPDALAYPPPKSETVAANLDQFLREQTEGEAVGRAAAEALRPAEDTGSRAKPPAPHETAGSGR